MFSIADNDQPLIGMPFQQNGEEVTYYFSDEAEAEAASFTYSINDVLALAGVWKDLDWDEMEKGLDRIRHESRPTPPISL